MSDPQVAGLPEVEWSMSAREFDLLSFIAQQVTGVREQVDETNKNVNEIAKIQSADQERLKNVEAAVAELKLADQRREEERERRQQQIEEDAGAQRRELGIKAIGALGVIGSIVVLILQGAGHAA